MFERLVQVRGQLAELVTALDPDALTGQTARGWWSELDRVERLAAAGKTLLTRRIAATHQPGTQATRTAAEELARQGGTTTGAARDAVYTSQRLPEQPGVAAAANPAEQDRLVDLAGRVSLTELREECARVRAAADPDPDATHRRIHAARALRQWIDGEGFWTLHATGTPAAGAAVSTALAPIIDQLFNNAHRAGRREPHQAYAFDALIHLAQHTTGTCSCTSPDAGAGADAGADDGAINSGADPAASAAGANGAEDRGAGADESALVTAGGHGSGAAAVPGDPGIFAARRQAPSASCAVPVKASSSERYLALLRVDVQALRRGAAHPGELCEIRGVGPVPVSVARQLLGQAVLKLVITDGVDVLNVTHLGRGPTAAQRAALLWANPTCSVQGCNRSRLEWDHRTPWAQTHHTRLDELDGLCSFHHDLKSRLGWALVNGTGKRAFVAPDDPRHPAYRARPGATGGPGLGPANPAPAAADAARPPPGPASRRRARRSRPAQPTLPEPPGDPPKAA
jgi:hypothetical protein